MTTKSEAAEAKTEAAEAAEAKKHPPTPEGALKFKVSFINDLGVVVGEAETHGTGSDVIDELKNALDRLANKPSTVPWPKATTGVIVAAIVPTTHNGK